MCFKDGGIYPNCPVVARTVEVGGLTKSQLIEKLRQSSIMMNQYGETLLADDRFTTSDIKYTLQTVELTVVDLGFAGGATTEQIFKRASELGLELCPLELGPRLRLTYLDQPEGFSGTPLKQNRAPSGSITVASDIITDDETFPKGFYLRKIDGVLWLRGYVAGQDHVWDPDNHFIFCK